MIIFRIASVTAGSSMYSKLPRTYAAQLCNVACLNTGDTRVKRFYHGNPCQRLHWLEVRPRFRIACSGLFGPETQPEKKLHSYATLWPSPFPVDWRGSALTLEKAQRHQWQLWWSICGSSRTYSRPKHHWLWNTSKLGHLRPFAQWMGNEEPRPSRTTMETAIETHCVVLCGRSARTPKSSDWPLTGDSSFFNKVNWSNGLYYYPGRQL